jgi:hypothetical protein
MAPDAIIPSFKSAIPNPLKLFENVWSRFQMRNPFYRSNLLKKNSNHHKIFLEIIFIVFWIKTSLGLKFCSNLSIFCISLKARNSRWIHLKNSYRFIIKKYGSQKLFVFECKTSSFIDTPGVTSRHPSFQYFLVILDLRVGRWLHEVPPSLILANRCL